MNNSDWLWKEVCVWLSIICHLLFAGVYGLTTDKCFDQDGFEGLCVQSRVCRHIAYKSLVSCGDDMVCCPFESIFRGEQPSWDTTPKTPTHRERKTERPPYNWDTTRKIYGEGRPEGATAPSVRTTTKPRRSSRQPPMDRTMAPHFPDPSTNIPEDDNGNTFHLCFTSDSLEGLCVDKEHCLKDSEEVLAKCGDATYCCKTRNVITPRVPSRRGRGLRRIPYDDDEPLTTETPSYWTRRPPYDDEPLTTKTPSSWKRRPPYDRDPREPSYHIPGKPTVPPDRTTTNSSRPRHRPGEPHVPPDRTTTNPSRPSGHIPSEGTRSRDFIIPSALIPGCGRRAFVKKIRPYVVGGQDSKEHWPWMAAIHVSRNGYRPSFVCGGSLITVRHVLTAAHCFNSRARGKDMYSVLLGTSNITLPTGQAASSRGLFIEVLNIRIHPQYVPNVPYHDIALLTLESKAPLSNLVSHVCLPSSVGMTLNSNLILTGWGHTTFGGYKSKFLQETELQLIPFGDCQQSYEELRPKGLSNGITSDMLCAGYPTGGVDACDGDSGGPLVVKSEGKWVQVGIVAFGVQCGDPRYPGVYTKVSTFVGWISQILSEYQHLI